MVALKLFLIGSKLTFAQVAKELGMSVSEVHGSVKRLEQARLVEPQSRRVRLKALKEFLVSGVPYVFPAKPVEITRGKPTAWGAKVLNQVVSSGHTEVPVWPDPNGKTKGVALDPLYRSAAKASANDSRLYDLLALVDALRAGRIRERNLAAEELQKRLSHV